MSSRIQDAFDALQGVIEALPGITVTENEDIPARFTTESTPVVNVTDGDDEDGYPLKGANNSVEFRTTALVAGYVTAADASSLRALREDLLASVWAAITNSSLLSTVWNVVPGKISRRLETEPGKPVAVFEMPVTLCFNARDSDLEIAA